MIHSHWSALQGMEHVLSPVSTNISDGIKTVVTSNAL